jgi:hypothetical protein
MLGISLMDKLDVEVFNRLHVLLMLLLGKIFEFFLRRKLIF